MKIELRPIGTIHTPFKDVNRIPFQGYASETVGDVEVFAEYGDGLKDVEGFSHIMLLYQFHKRTGHSLQVKPFLDSRLRGVFATRSPERPNHIGVSVVKLIERRGNTLRVSGVDMLDGTPLIDIKPYVPKFDHRDAERIGWLEGRV